MTDTGSMLPARPAYSLADLRGMIGKTLGTSGWHVVTQSQIDLFAEATGDRAALHVDPVAAATGPYGRTIAHGFLTLSLVAPLTDEALAITGVSALVNYGTNRVRFPAPVLVDSRLRLTTTLNVLEEKPFGTLLTLGFEIEVEGQPRKAAIGETVLLAMPERRNG
jgi:acyl dehydratase